MSEESPITWGVAKSALGAAVIVGGLVGTYEQNRANMHALAEGNALMQKDFYRMQGIDSVQNAQLTAQAKAISDLQAEIIRLRDSSPATRSK